jgi:DNA repair exonuclease SbcCD nuclease subunit
MKFICAGDLHIRLQAPENRIDSFFDAQYEKIRWILKQAQKYKADLLLPGDVFDSPKASHFLTSVYLSLFREFDNVSIHACMGQHDLRYHVNPDNTPFNVLRQANLLHYINKVTYKIDENITLYGADWNQPIPKPSNTKEFNILLIHKMIIPTEESKIWEGQTDYTLADSILKKGFDLVVSGDNHRGFVIEKHGGLLVNCGSIMRSTKVQINHKPFVVLFDTTTKKYEQIYIPIKPAEEVFDLDKIKKEKEHDKNITAFVDGLNEHKDMGLSFENNLIHYCKENKIDNSISSIIEEAKHGADTQGID